MTLINIADGTECRRRDEEVRSCAAGQNSKETVVGYPGAAGVKVMVEGCSEFLSSLPPDSIQLNFEITP